jgi:hypothetical protein
MTDRTKKIVGVGTAALAIVGAGGVLMGCVQSENGGGASGQVNNNIKTVESINKEMKESTDFLIETKYVKDGKTLRSEKTEKLNDIIYIEKNDELYDENEVFKYGNEAKWIDLTNEVEYVNTASQGFTAGNLTSNYDNYDLINKLLLDEEKFKIYSSDNDKTIYSGSFLGYDAKLTITEDDFKIEYKDAQGYQELKDSNVVVSYTFNGGEINEVPADVLREAKTPVKNVNSLLLNLIGNRNYVLNIENQTMYDGHGDKQNYYMERKDDIAYGKSSEGQVSYLDFANGMQYDSNDNGENFNKKLIDIDAKNEFMFGMITEHLQRANFVFKPDQSNAACNFFIDEDYANPDVRKLNGFKNGFKNGDESGDSGEEGESGNTTDKGQVALQISKNGFEMFVVYGNYEITEEYKFKFDASNLEKIPDNVTNNSVSSIKELDEIREYVLKNKNFTMGAGTEGGSWEYQRNGNIGAIIRKSSKTYFDFDEKVVYSSNGSSSSKIDFKDYKTDGDYNGEEYEPINNDETDNEIILSRELSALNIEGIELVNVSSDEYLYEKDGSPRVELITNKEGFDLSFSSKLLGNLSSRYEPATITEIPQEVIYSANKNKARDEINAKIETILAQKPESEKPKLTRTQNSISVLNDVSIMLTGEVDRDRAKDLVLNLKDKFKNRIYFENESDKTRVI